LGIGYPRPDNNSTSDSFVSRQIHLLFKLSDERILLPAVDFATIFFTVYVNRYYKGILQEWGGEKSLIFGSIN
jgi:hypothetical protein